MNSLEQLASDNNESALSGMGKYGSLYTDLVGKSKAIGEHYGYLPKPIKKDPVKAPDKINLDNINLNSPIKTIPK